VAEIVHADLGQVLGGSVPARQRHVHAPSLGMPKLDRAAVPAALPFPGMRRRERRANDD